MISVIIPAYNAEQWVGDAIRSVTAQTWTDLEIIVVDDGSIDDTSAIAESVGDPRLRVVKQRNSGASAARNHGLREARGDYIQYLDADDLLSPNKLEKQMEALKGVPEGSIASCPWGRFTGDAESAVFSSEPVWEVADPTEWLIISLGGGGMMQPAAWLTPVSVANAAGQWNEDLTLHDDGEYFARVLLAATRNVFVPDAKVFYRDVENSLSRRRSRSAIESAFAVCLARAKRLLAAKDDSRVRRALATQYAQFAYENALTAPDLVNEALGEIERLGASPHPRIGGGLFTLLSRVVGFPAAVHLRQGLREKRETV